MNWGRLKLMLAALGLFALQFIFAVSAVVIILWPGNRLQAWLEGGLLLAALWVGSVWVLLRLQRRWEVSSLGWGLVPYFLPYLILLLVILN